MILSLGAFSEAMIVKLGWKILFKDHNYLRLLRLAIVPS